MFRSLILALSLCLPSLAGAQGLSNSLSTSGELTRLDTGDQGRGWEGVGRLNIGGKGFCTASLIADDRVLTAAHCLFDKRTGKRIDTSRIEFLAGFRNGRASAYRNVRRAVIHPEYSFSTQVTGDRVRRDMAILELDMPIRNGSVIPFATDATLRRADQIGIVSYAHDRAEAPSLQDVCGLIGRQDGVLVMSCEVDFGSSGAPVFVFSDGAPRIVSVVSAKADMDGERVALGAHLGETLPVLEAELARGGGHGLAPAPGAGRIQIGGGRARSGAKFIRAQD